MHVSMLQHCCPTTTCCTSLAMHPVAVRCNMLDGVGSSLNMVKFSVQHLATFCGCYMVLYLFDHACLCDFVVPEHAC